MQTKFFSQCYETHSITLPSFCLVSLADRVTNKGIDKGRDGRMDRQTDRWTTDGREDVQMDFLTDGRTDGRTNGLIEMRHVFDGHNCIMPGSLE